jgi:aryl-alcohol dehydrogenase-like predicted oxidoreductase
VIGCAAARGVGVIARQVFASGLLTRPPDELPADLGDEPDVSRRKLEQLAKIAAIAAQRGRGRGEMALQFALACKDLSVVLLGISRADQLRANLRALDAAPLSRQELDELRATRRAGR